MSSKKRINAWIAVSIMVHIVLAYVILFTPLREYFVAQFEEPAEPEQIREKNEDPEKVEKIKDSVVETKKRLLLDRLDELYSLEGDLLDWNRRKLQQWMTYRKENAPLVMEKRRELPAAPSEFIRETYANLGIPEIYEEARQRDQEYSRLIIQLRGLDLGMRFEMTLEEALAVADIEQRGMKDLSTELTNALENVRSIQEIEEFTEIADSAIRETDMAIQRVKDFLRELETRDLAMEEELMEDLPPVELTAELPEALDPETLAELTPEELAQLTAEQLAELSPEDLARLSAEQLAQLTAEQLSMLSADQIAGLTAEQIAQLTPQQLSSLSSEQLMELMSTQGLSPELQQQLRSMAAQAVAQSENMQTSAQEAAQAAAQQGTEGETGEQGAEGEMAQTEGQQGQEGQQQEGGETLSEILSGMSPAQRQSVIEAAATGENRNANFQDLSGLMRALTPGSDGGDDVMFNAGDFPLYASDYAVPPAEAPILTEEIITSQAVPARKVVLGSENGSAARRGIIYVDSWYMIGPFENDGIVDFSKRFPPSLEFNLDAEYKGKFGQPVKWNFVQTNEIKQPVYPLAERAVYYAYTELFFEEATEMWVAFGSDDGAKFWINEHLVFQSVATRHPWQMLEGQRKVYFKKGRNEVKVRVETSPGVCFISMVLLPVYTEAEAAAAMQN